VKETGFQVVAQAIELRGCPCCSRHLGITFAKMLPAGLPATTGWQPVLPTAFLSPVDSSYVRFRSIANHKMKTRCFDHIDLRVKDMEIARKFYGKFLPQLGFVHESPGDDFHTFYSAGGDKPSEFFGFTEDKNHQPDGTRIAFWADTRDEVDRMAELVREAGGRTLEGPEICADYSPGYYAFFFEDPDGNKLEICCRESPIIAK
jgi:catechol 2,3-dioxygenase-like lactoylglutathione lyase family enzyme